jgi:hypothetical protein
MEGKNDMDNGIKEVIKRKRRPLWQIVSITVGIVVLINMLITLSNYFGTKYAGIVSIIILISSIFICTQIVMRALAVYYYKLIDGTLVFERKVGNKEKVILSVDIDRIQLLEPYNKPELNRHRVKRTYRLVLDNEYDKFYVGEFIENDERYRFIFKPSERLLRIIDRSLSNKVSE